MARSRGRHVAILGLCVLVVAALIVVVRTQNDSSNGPPSTIERRVLLEEGFDGDKLDPAIWNTCHWWDDEGCTISSNNELEWYRPEQVTLADGALQLTADAQPVRGSDGKEYPFRSGMVTTGPTPDGAAKLAWTYGRVEARVRLPSGRGLWPAIWMLPVDRVSRPEIDILEVLGQDPGKLLMNFHPSDRSARSPGSQYRLPGSTFAAEWHTVGLDWKPGLLTWLVDGQEVWSVRGAQVPSEPMYLLFNLAVGGVYPGPPDATTRFPATFAIDYVKITEAG